MDPSLKKKKKLLDNYARYSSIAFQMLIIILIGVFGGMKLDQWLNMSVPVFTIVFSILAVILSIYTVTKDLLKPGGKHGEKGLLTKMNNKYTRFLIRLIILSLITGVLVYLLSLFVEKGTVTSAFPYLLLMFFAITAAVHYILLRITTLNPRKFVGYFMLATTMKLLLYIIVVFAYLFIVRTSILQFILAFFILYIIFTVFEVVTILSQTKS